MEAAIDFLIAVAVLGNVVMSLVILSML